MITFIGEYSGKVDDKGRLVLPSPFKNLLPTDGDTRFVVKSNIATVYVDGEKVGASTEAIPKHWLLTTGALFFADEDGEEETIETAELRFWNEALGDEQIQKLGAIPVQ